MIRLIAAAIALALLSACGADGPPVAPAAKTTGVTLSGEAAFGLAQNGTK
jgi:predicted small lipoprotein YifL